MSETAVLEVFNHAVSDGDYRQSLFTEPGEILAGYDLTADEIEMLINLNADNFEAFYYSVIEGVWRSG
jgi:hypothetical protein